MKGRERERMEKRGIRSYTCEEIYKFRCKHGTIRRSVTKIASRSSASRSLKLGAHTHTHTHEIGFIGLKKKYRISSIFGPPIKFK